MPEKTLISTRVSHPEGEMKCGDCLIWQRRREDFNIAEQWDVCARFSKQALAEFAKLVPAIRGKWRQHELIRDEECPEGRCRLCWEIKQ